MSGKIKPKNGSKSYKKAEVVAKKTSTVQPARVETKMQPAVSKSELVPIRAYELWLLDGQCHGRDMHHWFEAEREINQN